MLARHPGRTVLVTLLVIGAIGFWFAVTPHRTQFFLDEDPQQVTVYVKARGNLSPEAQDGLMQQVEARMAGLRGIQSLYVRAGSATSIGGPNSPPNDTIGRISVEFVKYEARKALGMTGKAIAQSIRDRVKDLAGMSVEVREPEGGPPIGKAVQVQLTSHDPAILDNTADLIKAKLAVDPQLTELEDNRTSPGIEWNLTVDRQAAGRYGADVSSVGQAIQFLTGGVLAGRFPPPTTPRTNSTSGCASRPTPGPCRPSIS